MFMIFLTINREAESHVSQRQASMYTPWYPIQTFKQAILLAKG